MLMKTINLQSWSLINFKHIQLSTITQWTANLNNVQWENVSYVLKNRFLNDSRILVRNSEISVSRESGSVDKRICLQCKRFLAMQETWVRSLGQDPSKRKWQSTLVFLPVKSHEQRFLAGYNPWTTRVKYDLATKPSSSEQIFKKLKGKSKEKPTKIVKLYFFTPQKYILVTEAQ